MIRQLRCSCAILALMLISTSHIHACGGFFCTTLPMNQVAENILFVQEEGQITAHVQLTYSGSASDFAWILPLPTVPELAVSHNQIFTQLQFGTMPGFQLNFRDESGCGFPPIFRSLEDGNVVMAESKGVEVITQEQVGPYDTAVITSSDPTAIVDWLVSNDYRLDDLGVELLSPYVEKNSVFLALKLAANREVGDLQPIAITYASQIPCIPIRLTAVATEPNLGVLVWILAEHRAIPANYLHVQINEARIDWFNGGINYPEVVTLAANEAGGQAFVTDYAGPSKILRAFFTAEFDLDHLQRQKHPADFLQEALRQGMPRDAQMQTLIRRHVPMPAVVLEEGVLEVVFGGDRKAYEQAREDGVLEAWADQSFYNNMRAYDRYLDDISFDPADFADDLRNIVVEPLQEIKHLFEEKPYLTRLYTTLSADEMTVDPLFAYNPDLPEVSNFHFADGHWVCADPEHTPLEEWELVVTLSDGREIRSRPFADQGSLLPIPLAGPAAAVVERLDTSGPPQTISRMTTILGESGTNTLPTKWSLAQNYPNPFNASTMLSFRAPTGTTSAVLRIYDLLGHSVRTLVDGLVSGGPYAIPWYGHNDDGQVVASGVYIIHLQSGHTELTRKLLFLR